MAELTSISSNLPVCRCRAASNAHRQRLRDAFAPAYLWLGLGCALVPQTNPDAPIQVFSRSHNRSEVDVYLLCGARDANWLGKVEESGTAGFEISAEQAHCLPGLNFFLVVRKSGRGYRAGPVRPRPGGQILLVIEKYAGLSAAQARW